MDTGGILVDEDGVSGLGHLLKHKVEVAHELSLWEQLYPLNQNVDEPSLEQNALPLVVLDHFQHVADIVPLVRWRLVIFLDLAQHTHH